MVDQVVFIIKQVQRLEVKIRLRIVDMLASAALMDKVRTRTSSIVNPLVSVQLRTTPYAKRLTYIEWAGPCPQAHLKIASSPSPEECPPHQLHECCAHCGHKKARPRDTTQGIRPGAKPDLNLERATITREGRECGISTGRLAYRHPQSVKCYHLAGSHPRFRTNRLYSSAANSADVCPSPPPPCIVPGWKPNLSVQIVAMARKLLAWL
eukprot:scaffold90548_cov33-Tisochrysis_lutea.AAC.1